MTSLFIRDRSRRIVEIAVAIGFSFLAVLGFKKSILLTAAGIAGHGVFHLFHHLVIENPGMAVWWPGFCASVDIVLGALLAVRLWRETRRSRQC